MSIFEDTLDYYSMNNKLTDSNIYYKTIFALSILIINLFANSPIAPIFILIFCSILTIYVAGISKRFYLTFLAVPFAFAFITIIFMAFFFGSGPQIWSLGIFGWGVTADGLNRGVLVFFKVMGGFSALAFLILTTPANNVFKVFDDMHFPKIFTDLAILIYRYIFVFLDVTNTMYNSQKTRLGYSSYKSWLRCLGELAGMIFIRTWEQGETSYQALAARGYTGELNFVRTGSSIHDIPLTHWVALIIFLVGLCYFIYITGSINVVPYLIHP